MEERINIHGVLDICAHCSSTELLLCHLFLTTALEVGSINNISPDDETETQKDAII